MPKEKPPFMLPERLQRFATDAAGWQLDAVERDMQQNPSRFAEYAEARKRMDVEETALIQKLGSYALALEPYNNARRLCRRACHRDVLARRAGRRVHVQGIRSAQTSARGGR